jgi:hypothetical protein
MTSKERRLTRTGGRPATEGVIPGRYALSVGKPSSAAPDGWVWTRLTDVARLETGHTPTRKKPEYWGGDVPWIGIRDATGNHGRILMETEQYTNELGIANSSARVLPALTVCLSRTASVGYVVVMGRPIVLTPKVVTSLDVRLSRRRSRIRVPSLSPCPLRSACANRQRSHLHRQILRRAFGPAEVATHLPSLSCRIASAHLRTLAQRASYSGRETSATRTRASRSRSMRARSTRRSTRNEPPPSSKQRPGGERQRKTAVASAGEPTTASSSRTSPFVPPRQPVATSGDPVRTPVTPEVAGSSPVAPALSSQVRPRFARP